MRRCAVCGGELQQGAGFEKSAHERGGNPLAVDEFRCRGCDRRYLHSYEERFTGDIEGWAVREHDDETWRSLPPEQWPR